ncbi:hypothetical protein JKP88DRAFT_237857 [Tribonema minus]|uniref:Uncharacterized protein n=1 Tax=Tribonema minus TaxID=303371 RepID=A0A836CFS7_9STRA|nr:hypothetical protein JKP88DRAFT_237857 [Tribonema minus]
MLPSQQLLLLLTAAAVGVPRGGGQVADGRAALNSSCEDAECQHLASRSLLACPGMEADRHPSLVVVGFGKAGTTDLYHREVRQRSRWR